MNRGLLITLITACVFTVFYVLRKIKKSQFKIGDTLFWLGFCLLLMIMAVFPNTVYAVSNFIGFEAPANFIFVVFIFLLLIKVFFLDVRIAKLEDKLTKFAQKYATENEHTEN